jgi:hypothetical protein
LAEIPIKSVEWYINGLIITSNQKYQVSFIDNLTPSLVINNLNINDSGEYCCKVGTNHGDYKSTYYLNIEPGKTL